MILKLVEYAKANLIAERPNLGENQKFGLSSERRIAKRDVRS